MDPQEKELISRALHKGLFGACFDHLAIVVHNKNIFQALFTYLGLQPGYNRRGIGDGTTSMDTVVMHAPFSQQIAAGQLQIAFMSGNDGMAADGHKILSQISEYFNRRGNFFVQHIAIRCHNIALLVEAWSALGVKFITADENGPLILVDHDGKNTYLQCFTYPVVETSGTFLELKQIVLPDDEILTSSKQFRDANVEGLWEHVDRQLKSIFEQNIFGEPNLENSLKHRGAFPAI